MRFVTGLARWGWSWTKAHWQGLVSLAVSALVFTVVAALMPVAAPAALTFAVAGFLSGATGAIVSDLLARHVPTVKDVLLAAVISTVLSVGSFGLAKWIAPQIPKLWKPVAWLLRPAISVASRPAVTAVTTTLENVAEPLISSALKAAEASVGQVGTELAKSARPDETPAPPAPRAPPGDAAPAAPSSSPGLVGALNGTPLNER